jgi:hypothetical protein
MALSKNASGHLPENIREHVDLLVREKGVVKAATELGISTVTAARVVARLPITKGTAALIAQNFASKVAQS